MRRLATRPDFGRAGVLYLANNDGEMAKREAWREIAKEHQLETHLLDEAAVSNLVDQGSSSAKGWKGALYTPDDARAEAWQAVPAIAELAQAEGLQIRENCAVRTIDMSAGNVAGVHTEAGYIACEQLIVAAGVWSSLFVARHGVKIPQLSVKSTVCQTAPLPEVFAGNAADSRIAFRRREDGGYNLAGGARHDLYIGPDAFRHFFKYLPVAAEHLSDTSFKLTAPKGYPDGWRTPRTWAADEETPFETMRVLDPEPNHQQVAQLRKSFAERFPEIGEPDILHTWAGMIDAMPDIVPIVDRVPSLDGLIIATGMSGHGFGIGPGFGKIIAELAQNKPVGHDISRFRFSRFSDGSKLEPGPSI